MCDFPFTCGSRTGRPGSGRTSYLRPLDGEDNDRATGYLHPLDDREDNLPLLVEKICTEKGQPAKLGPSSEVSDASVLLNKLPTPGKGKTPVSGFPAVKAELSQEPWLSWTQLPEAMATAAAVAKHVYGIFAVNSAKELQAFALPLQPEQQAVVEEKSFGADSSSDRASNDFSDSEDDSTSYPSMSNPTSWAIQPSQGKSWEWPLTRLEAKERIVMLEQLDLMAEVEELRMGRRVAN
mmetsp:Transcript_31163/g.56498  ORF Transcript_31163/g.56498 Transcript_31163/m.56498 type:complete len:237 (+) Transcript_31163:166-876(+)